MKNKKHIITLENPCGENWDEMFTTANGKFCSSCKKNLIDFSIMSDNQIIQYLENHKTNTCGRFAIDQLNRPLAKTKIIKYPMLFYKFLAGIISLGLHHLGNAISVDSSSNNLEFVAPTDSMERQPKANHGGSMLNGIVLSKNNEPIDYAALKISKGGKYYSGTYADQEGKFSLNIQDSGVYEILATHLEYSPTKIFFDTKNSSNDIIIIMSSSHNRMVLGYPEYKSIKLNRWQKFKSRIRNIFVRN